MLETPPMSEASITFGMQRHDKKSNLNTRHDAASYRATTTELNSPGLSLVSNGKQAPSEKGIVLEPTASTQDCSLKKVSLSLLIDYRLHPRR